MLAAVCRKLDFLHGSVKEGLDDGIAVSFLVCVAGDVYFFQKMEKTVSASAAEKNVNVMIFQKSGECGMKLSLGLDEFVGF